MIVILKSKKGTHYAVGEYDGQRVTILPNSKINPTLSYAAMSERIKSMRNNPEYVSAEGIILKEIEFGNPSSAAQFVTGRSVNGYISWRIDDKISLKEYREKSK